MKSGGEETTGGMAPAESTGATTTMGEMVDKLEKIIDAGIAAGELRQFIERAERLHEERAALADDLKDLFAELKGRGYSVKAVQHILRLRRMDPDARQEMEAIVELYMNALGMV